MSECLLVVVKVGCRILSGWMSSVGSNAARSDSELRYRSLRESRSVRRRAGAGAAEDGGEDGGAAAERHEHEKVAASDRLALAGCSNLANELLSILVVVDGSQLPTAVLPDVVQEQNNF